MGKRGYQLEILPGERYEVDTEANEIAKEMLRGTAFEKTEQRGSIIEFPLRAKQLRARPDTWILVMGGTPCTKLTGLVNRWDGNARVGPHMEPSNLLFIAHEGIQILQKENEGRVLILMEQVIPAFEHWEEEITERLGFKKG